MTHPRTLRLLVLAGLLSGGAGLARAEDPPAPEAPAPEAPAPEAPAPDAPAPEAPAAETPAAPAADAKLPTGTRRWMLKLTHGPLRHVRDGGSTYHYVVLTVENQTGLARPWKPFVQAVVDGGKRTHVACGCGGALDAVRRRERDSSIQSLEASAGDLPSGQSRKIAAIFGPIDSGWNAVDVQVQGLVNPVVWHRVQKYGEKVVISDSAYDARNEKVMEEVRKAAKESGGEVPPSVPEYQEFVERRAYSMEWRREGDEFRPEDDIIEFVREGWKILGDPVVLRTVKVSSGSGS
jgi:hypothetical protein